MTAEEIRARPVLMSRIGYTGAVTVLVTFVVVAAVMPRANAGAHFGVKDQLATAIIGVILGGLLLTLTRPRLRADHESLHLRAFLGGWRTVPWDIVVGVEFPSRVRFARLVLPGEETLAIYAVQRLDRDQAIDVMRGLRALFALTRPPG